MRHLSLFTGSGIGDLAARNAGIETVAQCENDPCCRFVLRKLWPEAHLFEDVHDVSAQSLRERDLWPIDLISGGFPCQDLSTAGRGKGIEGGRSGLWREMFRVVRQVRPAWLLVENVPVLRVRGADRIVAPLERIGYTCWPLVAGAWAVGAPHKRDRVWIVAHRNGLGQCGEQGLADTLGPAIREATPSRPDGTDGVAVAGAGEAVADAEPDRLQGSINEESRQGTSGIGLRPAYESRWPSRPGEPQHDWEAQRLVESGVGESTHGLARELLRRLGIGDDRVPSQFALRQVRKKVEGYTRKAALRALGNAWVAQIAEIIYRWIVTQEDT